MNPDPRKARNLQLLDAIDSFAREPYSQPLWRVVRDGRDPLLGHASRSRWCNESFDVLYTSDIREGAIAEIYSLLTMQPIFPSRVVFRVHRISTQLERVLRLPDLATLERLGVDIDRYRDRVYDRTQQIADVAHFLGFDALVAPSARWNCYSAVLFTDQIPPENISLQETEQNSIDWSAWRRANSILRSGGDGK